jgi:hypothetical protein
MKDGNKARFVHTPIVVFGVLTVKEEHQDGRLVSLYRMDADAVGVGTW